MFETRVVRANECYSSHHTMRHNRDIFSIFFDMKVCCVLFCDIEAILMSTHNIENHPKLSQICNYGIFSKELKNEFETAVVNEPSVFEALKFYCIIYA